MPDVAIYMLYSEGRAYLWHQPSRDDKAAKEKARALLAETPSVLSKLFVGPTGVDEMDFVAIVIGVRS